VRRRSRLRKELAESNPTDGANVPPPPRTLTYGQRLAVYLSVLLFGLVASMLLHGHFGLSVDRAVCLAVGPLFLLTATGRPWWLYATIRDIEWFTLITNEIGMRVVLAVLGVLAVLFGVAGFMGS
jgi:hypothetical protein